MSCGPSDVAKLLEDTGQTFVTNFGDELRWIRQRQDRSYLAVKSWPNQG